MFNEYVIYSNNLPDFNKLNDTNINKILDGYYCKRGLRAYDLQLIKIDSKKFLELIEAHKEQFRCSNGFILFQSNVFIKKLKSPSYITKLLRKQYDINLAIVIGNCDDYKIGKDNLVVVDNTLLPRIVTKPSITTKTKISTILLGKYLVWLYNNGN